MCQASFCYQVDVYWFKLHGLLCCFAEGLVAASHTSMFLSWGSSHSDRCAWHASVSSTSFINLACWPQSTSTFVINYSWHLSTSTSFINHAWHKPTATSFINCLGINQEPQHSLSFPDISLTFRSFIKACWYWLTFTSSTKFFVVDIGLNHHPPHTPVHLVDTSQKLTAQTWECCCCRLIIIAMEVNGNQYTQALQQR